MTIPLMEDMEQPAPGLSPATGRPAQLRRGSKATIMAVRVGENLRAISAGLAIRD